MTKENTYDENPEAEKETCLLTSLMDQKLKDGTRRLTSGTR